MLEKIKMIASGVVFFGLLFVAMAAETIVNSILTLIA